jgi:protein phosphatase
VDHSLVRELVDDGTITEADARTHPQRNVITQSVGTREGVTPDFFRVPLGRDTLVLCSDGLTEEVEDDEILAVVTAAPTLDAAGDRLIERANENGGSDNVSVVLGSLDDE